MDESWDGNRVIWHGIIQHDGGREKERKKKVFFSAVASRRRSQRPIPIEIFHTFVTLHRYTEEFNFWRWRLRLTCESPSSRKEPPTRRLAKQTRIPTGGSAAGLRPDGDVCSTRPSWRTTSGHSGRRHWSHSSSVHHSRPDMTCSRANKQTKKKRKLNIGKTFHVRHTCGLAWPFWQKKLIHPFVIYVVLLFVCVARQRPMNHLDLLFHLLRNCCAHRSKSHEFAPDGGERTLIESRVFLRRVGRLSWVNPVDRGQAPASEREWGGGKKNGYKRQRRKKEKRQSE